MHFISQVAALLLLAQQEEKRILDEETISSQKCQIAELQKQLLQVVNMNSSFLYEGFFIIYSWFRLQLIKQMC